ncbi:MAG: aminotransferase class V-fold PLP-dependent enzyme, partial [Sphingomonadales bacterium]|nr:aminotransferase class V-fold PLP-dependent enzyme [Sphingomonadales bacterium]
MTGYDQPVRGQALFGSGPAGKAVRLRDAFPALADGWHYLDSAASAHKPEQVIDAVALAMGKEYATVHRGVYARSAEMTMRFEAARHRVAQFIGGRTDEIVFVRGATEAINLVAHGLTAGDDRTFPQLIPPGSRIMLSQLEHHSNIVPWQLAGCEIDVCPLTADG